MCTVVIRVPDGSGEPVRLLAVRDEDPDRGWMPWLDVLRGSASLDPEDERAIVRDNRPLGYPTLSTLLCVASIGADGIDVRYAEFTEPGHWNTVTPR